MASMRNNQSKRRRGGDAASGGSATTRSTSPSTTITVPDDLGVRGTKLHPLAPLIETQSSRELAKAIKSFSTLMLDRRLEITMREESHAKLQSQVTVINAGTPQPYISSSNRSTCPATCSKLLMDDPTMKRELDLAKQTHDDYKLKIQGHFKKISELEITIRKKLVRELFLIMLSKIAHFLIIEITDTNLWSATEIVTIEELTMKVVTDFLDTFSDDQAKTLFFASKEEIITEWRKETPGTQDAILTTTQENVIIQAASDRLFSIIPQMTIHLWKWHQNKKTIRDTDSKIKLEMEKYLTDSTSKQVESAIGNGEGDDEVPEATRKAMREEGKKIFSQLYDKKTKEARKKSSAGEKNHSHRPNKNGAGPRKGTNKQDEEEEKPSRGRSRLRSKSRRRNANNAAPPPALKKTIRWPTARDSLEPPPHRSSNSGRGGGRGGSNRGGRARGRGRR